MNFKKLMLSIEWCDIQNILMLLPCITEEKIVAFENYYSKAKQQKPAPNDEFITIIVDEAISECSVPSVLGSAEGRVFRLDYYSTEKFLGMKVYEGAVIKYGVANVVASIIWEASYYGS